MLTRGPNAATQVVDKASLEKPGTRQKLQGELQIHATLQHERLVPFRSAFEDEKRIYILLEQIGTGTTLADAIQSRGLLPEREAALHVRALLLALRHLHAQGIAHRDVKPANCLLRGCEATQELPPGEDSSLVLCDFGLAARVPPLRTGLCGTPNYIAPEVLARTGHGLEVDAWAVGALTYTMLVGTPPFKAPNVEQTYARVREGTYVMPSHVSATAAGFMAAAMKPCPRERASVDALLLHPFITAATYTTPASPVAAPRSPVRAEADCSSPIATLCTRFAAVLPGDASVSATSSSVSAAHTSSCELEAPPRGRRAPATPCTSSSDVEETDEVVLTSVSRWLDASDKCGLAYVLSNGAVGAVYLDGTRVVWTPRGFVYHDKRAPRRITLLREEDEAMAPDVRTKLAILHHLASRMGAAVPTCDDAGGGDDDTFAAAATHVRAWARTRDALVFRMSTRDVELHFPCDGAVLLLPHEQRGVVWHAAGPDARLRRVQLTSVTGSPRPQPAALLRKLRYARAVLDYLAADGKGEQPEL